MSDDTIMDDEIDQPIDQLQELIQYIAVSLVDEPDAVDVQAIERDRAVVFELTVASSDLGKVIGKDGRTARAMRTLLAATSAKLKKRAVLDILE
ncbi:MAG: KH domain-containing protein [Myxococcota bacterium]